jgi:hypothetical protein
MSKQGRPRLAAGIAVAAVAAIGAATAFAATPKDGYHYDNVKVDGLTVAVFMAGVQDGKITDLSGANPKCEGTAGSPVANFVYDGTIAVKANGKFKYKGDVDGFEAGPRKLNLKGKFNKPKQAKGKYTLEGCPGKVKFKTKFSTGG